MPPPTPMDGEGKKRQDVLYCVHTVEEKVTSACLYNVTMRLLYGCT